MMRFLICFVLGVLSTLAQAHLMVEGRGTVNFTAQGAYMVLSVPVAAFSGVDDNGNQSLEFTELKTHASAIKAQIGKSVYLIASEQKILPEGILLTLSPEHSENPNTAKHLVVMAHFATQRAETVSVGLWGNPSQNLSLTITSGEKTQVLLLSEHASSGRIFPSPIQTFAHYFIQGMEHVYSGLDHILFLLVVLSSITGVRMLLAALTVFTVGHAISLAVVVLGGVLVPAQVVEPIIAASIVVLAVFDMVTRKNKKLNMPRLGLIFACSLVHGLGLGNALATLGLTPSNVGVGMLGFNLGIESSQILISMVFLGSIALLSKLFGATLSVKAVAVANITAILIGGMWFVQRLIQA